MATFQDVGGQQQPQFMGPDAAKQSRRLAEMLMNEGMNTQGLTHWTQALGKVLQSGVGALRNDQATADVRDGSMAGNKALAQMLAGGAPDAAMANPYSAPDALKMQVSDRNDRASFANQKALLQEKLRMQNADPMYQLKMEKLRADIEATRSGGRNAPDEFGLNPILARDPNGNLVAVQPSKRGDPRLMQLPEGYTLDPGAAAGAKTQAIDIAKTRAELPEAKLRKDMVTDNLNRLKAQAEKVMNAPGLGSVVGGLYQAYVPNVREKSRNAQTDLENLKVKISGVVLQSMRDMSKTGGAVGQVTEREWPRLENMIANLDATQGDEQFLERLGEVITYADNVTAQIQAAYQADLAKVQGGASGMTPIDVPQDDGWQDIDGVKIRAKR